MDIRDDYTPIELFIALSLEAHPERRKKIIDGLRSLGYIDKIILQYVANPNAGKLSKIILDYWSGNKMNKHDLKLAKRISKFDNYQLLIPPNKEFINSVKKQVISKMKDALGPLMVGDSIERVIADITLYHIKKMFNSITSAIEEAKAKEREAEAKASEEKDGDTVENMMDNLSIGVKKSKSKKKK